MVQNKQNNKHPKRSAGCYTPAGVKSWDKAQSVFLKLRKNTETQSPEYLEYLQTDATEITIVYTLEELANTETGGEEVIDPIGLCTYTFRLTDKGYWVLMSIDGITERIED